jgi:hypothetical protein
LKWTINPGDVTKRDLRERITIGKLRNFTSAQAI